MESTVCHEFKSLAIEFRRDGIRETHYAYGTGDDALDVLHTEFHTGIEDMGMDSLAWVRDKLDSIGAIDALPCEWSAHNGDFRVYALCG